LSRLYRRIRRRFDQHHARQWHPASQTDILPQLPHLFGTFSIVLFVTIISWACQFVVVVPVNVSQVILIITVIFSLWAASRSMSCIFCASLRESICA
jgi:hypothetical protein